MGAMVAISSLATSCKEAAPRQEATKLYDVMTISKGDTYLSSDYSASIRSSQFVDIRPQISGVITKILLKEGANITRGEELFVIDQTPYKAALKVATATVQSSKARVATAAQNKLSGEELLRSNVISENEYQILVNEYSTAKADLALAEAEETIARENLSYTTIKSPVDGASGMINYRVGALVSSTISEPLVSVADNSTMDVYFTLSESKILDLSSKLTSNDSLLGSINDVALTLNNGATYPLKGKVEAISGIIQKSTGSVTVKATFENPDGVLRDGGNGTVILNERFDDAIVIPKSASFEIQNKIFVFKVIEGKALQAEISVHENSKLDEYLVLSGLNVGDVIIAKGAGLVREGAVITERK